MDFKACINGHYFDCEGGSIYGGDLHMTISLGEHSLAEFVSAVEEGNDPVLIVRDNPANPNEYIVIRRFVGFNYLKSTALTFKHMFSDQTVGTMLDASLCEEPLKDRVSQSESDITDIQMAVAELAELIVGGE